jgi:N-acetylmuramoyl-L-alanine amidase
VFIVIARRAALGTAAALMLLGAGSVVVGQSPPSRPLHLLSAQGSRPLPSLVVNDVEMVALDELAAVFPLTIRDDTAARAIAVTWQGKTAVLTSDQALASIEGRLVSLPVPPVRIGGKWFVPVEFIGRVLPAIGNMRLELRKASRLVIAGDLRVPRVILREDVPGPQARLTFDVAPPTPHTIVQEESRLLVRFDADALDTTLPAIAANGLVQSVRAESQTTLAIELGPRFGSFRASDVPGDASTARLVIDVFPAAGTAPPPTAAAPVPATPAIPALPGPTTGVRVIVIDPGHGGDDGGAHGKKGTLEKDVTLSVARRIKAALESRIGARVLLTRDDDRTISQDDRAAFANNNKGDLFVSLHAGGSSVADRSGASVFYLSVADHGPEAPAPSAGIAMPVFGGGTREIDVIPWQMAQALHVDDSASFGRRVEAELKSAVPMSPKPLQAASLRVLVGANMPAVAVEMGYLTNPGQEDALASGGFQARIAQALANAIVQFDSAMRSLIPQPAPGAGR